MAITEGAGIQIPMNGDGEFTVGLLGAKLDPMRTAFGIDGKYLTEIRLLEIERRILALESNSAPREPDA